MDLTPVKIYSKTWCPIGLSSWPSTISTIIDDLHVCIKNSSMYHFADDTNLLCIGKSIKKIQKKS